MSSSGSGFPLVTAIVFIGGVAMTIWSVATTANELAICERAIETCQRSNCTPDDCASISCLDLAPATIAWQDDYGSSVTSLCVDGRCDEVIRCIAGYRLCAFIPRPTDLVDCDTYRFEGEP